VLVLCQKYQHKISEAANVTDEEKSKRNNTAAKHLMVIEKALSTRRLAREQRTLPARHRLPVLRTGHCAI